MYEKFMGDYQPSLHLLYFSTYSGIKNYLPYPKHMLRAHYKLLV